MHKILVIEDENPLRETILETLQLEGFEPLGAHNGVAGIEMAKQHVPDVIICDIAMPESDGYEVLFELSSDPNTATIPFVFLTAKASPEDQRYGMNLGADDYLVKPFTNDQLFKTIHARLKKKEIVEDVFQQRIDNLSAQIIHSLPHELRTPLNIILGYSNLLVEDHRNIKDQQLLRMAQMIYRSGERLHRLTENYLLYSQIALLNMQPDRVERLREQRCDDPLFYLQQAGLQIATEYTRERDILINSCESASIQISDTDYNKIVYELIDNAFKFSEEGMPVKIWSEVKNDMFITHVQDVGRGMTHEQIKNIGAYMQFERDVYEQQGAGLGLIIVQNLAQLYDGSMNIESTHGSGTHVTVSLKMIDSSNI